jgi:hypothetical protein
MSSFYSLARSSVPSTLSFDMRGHGKADGGRCKISSLDDLITDLNSVLELVMEKLGSSTRILVGGRKFFIFRTPRYISIIVQCEIYMQ